MNEHKVSVFEYLVKNEALTCETLDKANIHGPSECMRVNHVNFFTLDMVDSNCPQTSSTVTEVRHRMCEHFGKVSLMKQGWHSTGLMTTLLF